MSQQGQRFQFDFLIIGSGLAGCTSALKLHQLNPKARIAVISKSSANDSNSSWAQGGIAAVTTPKDSIASHVDDTLAAGAGACNLAAAQTILSAGKQTVEQLIAYGVNFDQENEDYALTQEGGHSQRRIFYHGDNTGAEIIRALLTQLKQTKNITLFENHVAVNLITDNHAVIGCYVLDAVKETVHTVLSASTLLATGGAGKVYRYTTNPEVATGDGIAMAYRAGATIRNMAFYQFHPTLLYHPKLNNFLISEAVRGEGAYLRLPNTGERFMQRYDANNMELATRDIVARAIFSEIENGALGYVHLDISHRDRSYLQNRFPTIFSTLMSLGIDMSQDPIPVVPAAHYLCGGIATDLNGQTNLERLVAIGETACTGLHGANRLPGNALLEAAVMGERAATYCHETWQEQPLASVPDWDSPAAINERRASQINAHWRGLRGEMTSYAGIVRTEAGLQDVINLIQVRRKIIEDYYWKHAITRDLIELRNIILVAQLITEDAMAQKESCGGHHREDAVNT